MNSPRDALPDDARIAVAGAGAIGVYVGAKAAVAGRNVAFLGRERFVEAARAEGLGAIDPDGLRVEASPARFEASTEPSILAGADVVLVTVRSRDTPAIAGAIRDIVPAGATVVSLQNGVANAARLREALPNFDVRAGMVAYNVLLDAPNRAKRATSGAIFIEAGAPAGVAALLDAPGAPASETDEIERVQWGKVLLNLNNALNALSGATLVEELGDRNWRRVLALCQDEALAALKLAGVRPVSAMGGVPPALLPMLMRLPNAIFRPIATAKFKISAEARSSMQDDLVRRRETEIDDLQGEVVRLAERVGLSAPTNAAVIELIREAETAAKGPPMLGADAVVSRVAAMSRTPRSASAKAG